jgi:alkanesulfonate monooxygenase SsuD/methylene tetrahydromethanopterin reductase-like flavin-dependent oxidoreductase (luciferase family)
MPRDLEADIVTLLEEAETAHSVYEADSLSGDDPAWAAWYAAYLLEMGLRDLLPRSVTGDPDTVAERLKELHAALQDDDPREDWVRFFAKRLAASERDAQASGHR